MKFESNTLEENKVVLTAAYFFLLFLFLTLDSVLVKGMNFIPILFSVTMPFLVMLFIFSIKVEE